MVIQNKMMKQVTDYFDNLTPEQFEKDLEKAQNLGFGKTIERMIGCDECLRKHGECQHCVLGND